MTGFVLALALAAAPAQTLGGVERNTREGAEHFEAGRLEEALRAFSRARDAAPGAPENDLNLAGVHYRMGEAGAAPAGAPTVPGPGAAAAPEGEGPFAEAVRGYRAALAGGAEGVTRRDAFYNLGNTLFRSGAFREAAAAFGEAVALDPEDREARQNLEQALLRAEEQEQQQQPQQDSGGGERDSDGQDPQESESDDPAGDPSGQQPPPDSGEGGPDREQPRGSSDPENEPPDEDLPPESSEPPPGEEGSPPEEPAEEDPASAEEQPAGADAPNPTDAGVPEISPEQAERILAALAEVERRFQEEQLEKRRARALRRGRH